jgi:hypothetical protein
MKTPANLALDPTALRNRSSSHDRGHSFLAARSVVGVAGARVVVGAAASSSESRIQTYKSENFTHLPFGLL